MNRFRLLVLTAGGTGLLTPGPGTWGSLVPIGLALLIGLSGEPWLLQATMAALVLLGSWACIAFGPWAETTFGSKDPQAVVIDEVAGQALTLLILPWPLLQPGTGPLVLACLVGFGTFRLFDISKPPPIRGFQTLPAGWGVLIDDLLAAVPAGILGWGVLWVAGLIETATI